MPTTTKQRKGLLTRTKEFLKHFPTNGDSLSDEIVETSFHCAYQDEILLHGILYITQYRFCFKSSVLGRRKTIAVPWHDVLDVRKAKIAYVFPTAIQLETYNGCSYIFASFLQRETAYKKLITCHIDYRRYATIPSYTVSSSAAEEQTSSTAPPPLPSRRRKLTWRQPTRNSQLKSWMFFLVKAACCPNDYESECSSLRSCLILLLFVGFLLHFFHMYRGVKILERRLSSMTENGSYSLLGDIASSSHSLIS